MPTATGGALVAAERCAGCWPRHGSAASASTAARSSPTAEWPGIISRSEGERDPGAVGRSGAGARTRAARRYLLVRPAGAAATAASTLVARPRADGTRRYACAKGVGFAGCGKTYINADAGRAIHHRSVLHRLESRDLQRARSAPAAARRTRERCWQEAETAQAQLEELPAPTASGEITMSEWKAARKPIDQRLTAARKQLAKVTHGGRARSTSATRPPARRLGIARPQPQHANVAAVLDSVGLARPAAATTVGRVALAAGLRGPEPAAPRPRQHHRVGHLTGTPAPAQALLDPGHRAGPRSSDPLRPAGWRPMPPLHRRRQPNPLRRRAHEAGGALDHVLRRPAVAEDLLRLEALRRPRSGAAPPAGARRSRSRPA